jgi:hypothetical protein
VTTHSDLELELETSHGYSWQDLREVNFGSLDVGRVVFKPSAGQMYASRVDGSVEGLYGGFLMMGTAWTITAREGQRVTLVRHDGQARQTVSVPDAFVVLAVDSAGTQV